MRKTLVALAVPALLAISLAGCTAAEPNPTKADPSTCASAFDADTPLLDQLAIAPGELEDRPSPTLPNPLQIPAIERSLLIEGEGPHIIDTNQLVQVTVAAATSTSGEILGYMGGENSAQTVPLGAWAQYVGALPEQLLCVSEGSRVALTIPAERVSQAFVETFELEPGQGGVFIVDVLKVVPNAATGADVFNQGMGLPSVIRDTRGRPGLVMPTGDAPTEPVMQTLLQGDGPAIDANSSFYAHILGVAWHANKTFGNTWDQLTPSAVSTGQFPPVVAAQLEGVTVGSQVMIVVPASEVTPEAVAGTTIPANTALVYVIDVLALAP